MPKIDNQTLYDVSIVGGGIAGLAISIQLARKGYKVILFEKESYPFHKVCGEYISMESWNFLEHLGMPLRKMKLPIIKKLLITTPNGTSMDHRLSLGGFGISRYTLDASLKNIASKNGVTIYDRCKVTRIHFLHNTFTVETLKENFKSKVCCGCYGKQSYLDIHWNRDFLQRGSRNKMNTFVGVKYHIKIDLPSDTIALHNFDGGYCGISQVDHNKFCLCYLTTIKNLKKTRSIDTLEKTILYKNPHLEKIFTTGKFLYTHPITTSHISLTKKEQVYDHVLLAGDAAGVIAPLCGNGMSIALHTGKMLAIEIDRFLNQKITREQMENIHVKNFTKHFSRRLYVGRKIQHLLGKKWITHSFIKVIKRMPAITNKLVAQTHGDPF